MILKILKNKNLINFLLILSIFCLDRFTKEYVIYLKDINNNFQLFSSPYLDITLIWNNGIAFGLFSFDEIYFYNFLTGIIFLIIVIICFLVTKSTGIKKLSFLMILGGAFGNFYDRVIFNAVPDFIDFHVGNYHWFIFNVADIFISLGVIFLIIIELFDTNKKEEL